MYCFEHISVFHVPKISWKYSFRLIVISRSKLDLGIYRAPRPAGPSTEGGPGESPPENFWKRGAIWCILGSFQHWIATKIVTFFLCFQVIKKKICKIFVMNIKLISNLFSESTQINMTWRTWRIANLKKSLWLFSCSLSLSLYSTMSILLGRSSFAAPLGVRKRSILDCVVGFFGGFLDIFQVVFGPSDKRVFDTREPTETNGNNRSIFWLARLQMNRYIVDF